MIRLLTRGDDAASSHSANAAIRAAATAGILRNAGVMAPCYALKDAYHQLAGLEDVALGMHLTLTSEWDYPRWGPILPREKVPSLLDDEGYFYRNTNLLHETKPSLDEMMAETQAQLDLLRGMGFKIVYLDEHMGVGWPEQFGAALAEFARREGLVHRPEVSSLSPPKGATFSAFDHAGELIASLEATDEGTYLTVAHPCFDDAETRAIRDSRNAPGFHGKDREGQRLQFSRPDVVEYVKSRGIELIRYDQI